MDSIYEQIFILLPSEVVILHPIGEGRQANLFIDENVDLMNYANPMSGGI
jgi:hypothetical protein